MLGLQHQFAAGLRAETDVQYAIKGSRGQRWNNLHFAQGNLDGACGICAFIQAACLLLQLPRVQAERLATSSRSPWRELWAKAQERFFDGTTWADMQSFAEAFAPQLECQIVRPRSMASVGATAASAIRRGAVPLLQFDSASWSHWSTVLGVELGGASHEVRALLTLDPEAPAPWTSFFNARLDLNDRAKESVRTKPPFQMPYRHGDGSCWAVKPRCLVILSRAQAP